MPKPKHLPILPKQALISFGKMLALRRKERGWRQEDLAARIGIIRQTIARIEAGDPAVAIGYYFTAAWLLDLPIFPGIDSKSSPSHQALVELFKLLKDKYPQRVSKRSEKKIDDNF